MDIDSEKGLIYTLGNESVVKLAVQGLITIDETNLSSDPKLLRLNKQKTKLFIASENERYLHIVSTTNMMVLNTIALGLHPILDLAISDDESYISFTTYEWGWNIWRITD